MVIEARPGFEWQAVNWGAPDARRTDRCSYCDDPFPDDDSDDCFVPLILSRSDGWVAEFCDHCQAAWFGIETFPDPPEEPEEAMPDLGPCCICDTKAGVRNMIMLDRRCTVPGHGWGCAVCGLPSDGASSVLCDGCLRRYHADPATLTIACSGYPASDGRVPIADLAPFTHDDERHFAEERRSEFPA